MLRGLVVALTAVLLLYIVMRRPASALQGWDADFAAALSEAAATNKKVLAAFYLSGCAYCEAMDRTVLGTAAVRSALRGYIPVRVNMAIQRELADRYAVAGAPTFIVLDDQGRLLARSVGYQPVAAFVTFLERASTIRAADTVPGAVRPSGGS